MLTTHLCQALGFLALSKSCDNLYHIMINGVLVCNFNIFVCIFTRHTCAYAFGVQKTYGSFHFNKIHFNKIHFNKIHFEKFKHFFHNQTNVKLKLTL